MTSDQGGRLGERGSASVFVVFFAMAALALASLLVDVGNAINAQERAADIAEQAARAAASDIDITTLRAGGNPVIDRVTACTRAGDLVRGYASTSGIAAAMTDCGVSPTGQQAEVFVSVTTTPVISAFFGSFTMRAHETACAEFTQGQVC